MVQVHPGPPTKLLNQGGLAQLVERLLCKQEVSGSTPLSSTKLMNNKNKVVQLKQKISFSNYLIISEFYFYNILDN